MVWFHIFFIFTFINFRYHGVSGFFACLLGNHSPVWFSMSKILICISIFHLFSILQARIKKIMQSDEDVGKVAAAVPVLISKSLELFAEKLLRSANDVIERRGARTLTPSHL